MPWGQHAGDKRGRGRQGAWRGVSLDSPLRDYEGVPGVEHGISRSLAIGEPRGIGAGAGVLS